MMAKVVFRCVGFILFVLFLEGCACHGAHYQYLNKPIREKGIVLNFAAEAAVSVYTYNYSTYQQDFLFASQYFTPEGWNYFRAMLEQSGDLDFVIKRKMIVSAVAENMPVLLSEGISAGRDAWNIHVPLYIVFQNDKQIIKRHVIANLIVVKTPHVIGTRGLGVESFLVN